MSEVLEMPNPTQTSPKRNIRKVAVLGSGVMGSRIACHFAHIGCEVILLDIVPFDLSDAEKTKPAARNRLVNDALQAALKGKPSPIYTADAAKRISTGNFDDDLHRIAEVDLIVEAIIERLDIKQSLYEKVEKHRRPGTLVCSNTSGIPMQFLVKGRSEDFARNFCGMHFFNPPRYLRLLEIIPAPTTDPEVVKFLMHYGDLYLGKETVLCKDTPAFIANRVGVYSLVSTLHAVEKMGMGVNEVDKITGTLVGNAKSATFRTLDVVGIDTSIKVAKGLYENLPHDESRDVFQLPGILSKMEENNWLGDKTQQGYYKKTKNAEGKKEILELDLKSFAYKSSEKVNFPIIGEVKDEPLKERLPKLFADQTKVGEFLRMTYFDVLRYVTYRIPEIADELFRIDQGVKAGFAREIGPFELWDVLGVRETLKQMEDMNLKPAQWVYEMLESGAETFYTFENGVQKYYDIPSKAYKTIPGTEKLILLEGLRQTNIVWENEGATLFDLGDGILGIEYHTKMNAMGGEIIEALNTGIEIAEKDFRGLVIGNEAPNFSAGANLLMVYMYAMEQEFDEIDLMIAQFQNTIMRLRYSAIPVVAAPSGLALGGGCETLLHVDHVQAHTESYIGLVEVGVGVIPAGGGTKELTMRTADSFVKEDAEFNRLQEAFLNIAMAKVATSAHEAREMGLLRPSDAFTLNRSRLLADAKQAAINLAEAGYVQPTPRKDIKVLGQSAYASFAAGVTGFRYGNYISDHDQKIALKVAHVMSGGGLSGTSYVSEQYLLDLEREAFLSLTGEPKTIERIHSILFKGKPLRN